MSETPAKSRRRWFQFSLRTLLVLVTVFCLWLGRQVNRANQQREAVEAVESHGGSIVYDYQMDGAGRWINGAESPGPNWIRQLIGDDYFMRIRSVSMSGGATDAIFKLLQGQERLSRIYLAGINHVTDEGLKYIGGLTSLEKLTISSDAEISDAGLTHLKRLSKLRELALTQTWFTDAAVNDLKSAAPNCRVSYYDAGAHNWKTWP